MRARGCCCHCRHRRERVLVKPFLCASIDSIKLQKIPSSNDHHSSLFEQFRRLANVYFLVISVLLLIGTYTDLYQSPLTPYTTLIPLCVVLAITMGKEGFEDIKRHTADLKTNNRPSRALSLTAPGAFEPVLWRHIRVGRCVCMRVCG